MSLLVISEILRLFVSTLTADQNYSSLNSKNLAQSIQMQFSKKQKTLSEFLSSFLKSILSFEHFFLNR